MLTAPTSTSANQGSQGLQTAAAAEKLEAVFWNVVLSAMEKTGLQGGSLGTGAGLYNGIARQALSEHIFKAISANLTHSMVGQLSQGAKPQQMRDLETSQAPLLLSLSNLAGAQGCAPATPGTHATTIAQATAFAHAIWPCLQQSAAQLGVSPVALLSQAALETGWGSSVPGNNLFGVKAVGGASATTEPTTEFVNGTAQEMTAQFANYLSLPDSVAQYTQLIQQRYPGAIGARSVSDYATALASSGYATDRAYAAKMTAIAQSPLMADVLQSLGTEGPPL